MCLAVPGEIVEIDGDMALVDYGGVRKRASLLTMPDAEVGNMVIVHAGFVISKIDVDEAQKTLAAFQALEKAMSQNREHNDDG